MKTLKNPEYGRVVEMCGYPVKCYTIKGQQPPPKGDGLFARTSNASVD